MRAQPTRSDQPWGKDAFTVTAKRPPTLRGLRETLFRQHDGCPASGWIGQLAGAIAAE
jgi:hypothetical protein